jgi:hypothetical protein
MSTPTSPNFPNGPSGGVVGNGTLAAQTTSPVHTFKISLETLQKLSWSLPNRTTLDGNETVTEANNMKTTRSTLLPILPPNVQNLAQADGYTFTVYGLQAVYVANLAASLPDGSIVKLS